MSSKLLFYLHYTFKVLMKIITKKLIYLKITTIGILYS